ncbi:hypothetical protein NQ317_012104 [Molorchus minor]|uniref:Uncharacterized protein n=1 Tax=Molorchus minor TaxID=1323400 RepID=A0ABQ9J6U6_9CUCU|nr:hypothetical protein NQ317_012104 [Molorchus minor]
MENTPSKRKLSIKRTNISLEDPTGNDFEDKSFLESENGDSPVHIACTQEGANNFDVVWDWNSPQAKQAPKRKQNRFITRSPKIPLKRHPSNNNMQNFEKLREELLSLREEISVPDNEDCLVLSPLQESEYKNIRDFENVKTANKLPEISNSQNCYDDLFNDDVDEQLVLCSQRIEAFINLEYGKSNVPCAKPSNDAKISSRQYNFTNNIKSAADNNLHIPDMNHVNVPGSISSDNKTTENYCKTGDDSFGRVLDEFKLESNESFMATVMKTEDTVNKRQSTEKKIKLARTNSENQYNTLPQTTTKFEFSRTRSFDLTLLEDTKDKIPQSKLDEIERKRLEALAKLEAKRKQGPSNIPVKCTPEEIEQKRQQALAKREAKRQQELIERKKARGTKKVRDE